MKGIPIDRIKSGQYWEDGERYSRNWNLLYICRVEKRDDGKAIAVTYQDYTSANGWSPESGPMRYSLGESMLGYEEFDWRLVDGKTLLWPAGTPKDAKCIVRRVSGPNEFLAIISRGEEMEGDMPWRMR